MFILPTHRGLDWRHFPWATSLLLLLNIASFFLFQGRDDERYEDAMSFYYDSGLAETEFKLYIEHLRKSGDNKRADKLRDYFLGSEKIVIVREDTREETADPELDLSPYEIVYGDPAFVDSLHNNKIIDDRDDRFLDWRQKHDKFLHKRSLTIGWRFGLSPAERDPITFITHQFLHGDTMHLVGNMVFLGIIGLPIELVIGGLPLLVAYLIGGVLAGGGFALASGTSPIPLVGASGAIAGLMGLYAAIYGLRKIKVFYHLLVYFGYARLPALVLLPVWIAKELLDLWWLNVGSNVAYEAHAAGLVAGGFLGIVFRFIPSLVDQTALDEPGREETQHSKLAQARHALAALKVDQALQLLLLLQREHPEHFEVACMLYRAYRLKNDPELLHKSARRVLLWPNASKNNTNPLHDIFMDYYQASQGKPHLTVPELIAIAKLFVEQHTATTERIANALLSAAQPAPETADLLWLLAVHADRQNRRMQAKRYCEDLLTRFPANPLAKQADQLKAKLS